MKAMLNNALSFNMGNVGLNWITYSKGILFSGHIA